MTSSEKPVLTGARVTLRDGTAADAAARFALGNDPEIQALFGADPTQVRPITEDAAQAWVNSVVNDSYAWVIEAEGKLLGSVRLHSINRADKRANVAIGILNTDTLGRGYGTEAMHVLARHAFDTIGMHRLCARVLAYNTRAIAAYKKVGFVEEGRERESAFISTGWEDDVIMGLLPRDLKAPA